MPTATVSVLYSNPPAPGKSYGSIKTKELGYLSIKPNEVRLFNNGQTYTIEYEEKGQYKNFVRLIEQPQLPLPHGKTDEQAKNIFITGVVGRAMGSGAFKPEDIKVLTLEANDAWRHLASLTEECPF